MGAITRKQLRVLKYIYDFIQQEQWAPTYDELCSGLGLKSRATIHQHLKVIEEKKLIEREKGSGRAIRLTEKGKTVLKEK
ncbi:hypothetical protein CI088_00130 [Enterococcus plantarum]|uniref:LexA repressor DNA-binding domain-containing protein n=1 Tax=Enterococcus plantarum TaxID=1077675 RepID=A0A2W3ZVH1_9ENTE|nr:winged-helix domain-containing protein [Enterococcus plantarum]PZL78214.1 hypothetical protein CI088_00130 [Enterococcus plantarum]